MESPTETEKAENKPEKANQPNKEEKPQETRTIIDIRHNYIFPRNLDYIPSIHQMQPMPNFSFYRPGYWPGPPNLPTYLRFRELQNNNNFFEQFI